MKKSLGYFTLIMLFFGIISTLNAQNFTDLDKSPMDAVILRNEDNSPLARLIYSRPFKRNRTIFGELVPYGEVWRTGANETTEIRFYEHCLINGKPVRKGTYGLFSIPNEEEWILILNEEHQGWGAYNYNADADVFRFNLPAQQTATVVEQFSISTRPADNGGYILMGWDDTFLRFKIEPDSSLFPTDNATSANDEENVEEVEEEKKKKKRKKFLWIF
jgi:hypothetical protein